MHPAAHIFSLNKEDSVKNEKNNKTLFHAHFLQTINVDPLRASLLINQAISTNMFTNKEIYLFFNFTLDKARDKNIKIKDTFINLTQTLKHIVITGGPDFKEYRQIADYTLNLLQELYDFELYDLAVNTLYRSINTQILNPKDPKVYLFFVKLLLQEYNEESSAPYLARLHDLVPLRIRIETNESMDKIIELAAQKLLSQTADLCNNHGRWEEISLRTTACITDLIRIFDDALDYAPLEDLQNSMLYLVYNYQPRTEQEEYFKNLTLCLGLENTLKRDCYDTGPSQEHKALIDSIIKHTFTLIEVNKEPLKDDPLSKAVGRLHTLYESYSY